MKKTLLLLFLFGSTFLASQESAEVYTNNIYAGMSAFGQIGFPSGQEPHFGIDREAGDYSPTLLHAAYFQMTAYNEDNELLHLNDTSGMSIANTCPIEFNSGEPLDETGIFHRVWKINRDDILNHIADYNDNGQIDDPISDNIEQWPSKGNSYYANLGTSINQNLAPFYDLDNNGIYEPIKGDYPVLESGGNIIPNEMLFSVHNDYGISGSMGVEIHQILYAFHCDSIKELNNAIFLRKKVINRSNDKLEDVAIGHLIDFDLGCLEDDAIGTAIDLNSTYVYNRNAYFDGEAGGFCSTTGQENRSLAYSPGAFAATLLSHDMTSCVLFDRRSPADELYDSQSAFGIYNLLHGIGCLANSTTCDTINYSFVDYPEENTTTDHMGYSNWSAETMAFPSTVLDELAQQAEVTLDYVYYYNRISSNSWEAAVDLQNKIPLIQQYYDEGFPTTCYQSTKETCSDSCVWPGDVNTDGIVLVDDYLPLHYARLNDFTGYERSHISSSWLGFPSRDWNEIIESDNANAKHSDCNGDGSLSSLDYNIVFLNYENKQNDIELPQLILSQEADYNIEIKPFRTKIKESDVGFLKTMTSQVIDVKLPDNHDYLGFTFSLKLDPDKFVTNGFEANRLHIGQDYLISKHTDSDEYRQDYFVGATDGQQLKKELRLRINTLLQLNNDLRVPDGMDSLYIPFPMYNLKAMNMDGEYVDVGVKMDSVWLLRDFSSTNDFQANIELTISPNPTNTITTFQSTEKINNITLFSVNGSIEKHVQVNDYITQLNVADISSGMYIAQINCDNGILRKKLIISR